MLEYLIGEQRSCAGCGGRGRILREERDPGESSGLVRRGDPISPKAAAAFVKANRASHSVRRMHWLLGVLG